MTHATEPGPCSDRSAWSSSGSSRSSSARRSPRACSARSPPPRWCGCAWPPARSCCRRRTTELHRPDAARLAGGARLRRQPRDDELGDLPVLLPDPARHRGDDRVHRPAVPGVLGSRRARDLVWVLLAARRRRPPRVPADRARPRSASCTPCSPAPRGRRTSCSARAPGGGGRASTGSPSRASSPPSAMTLPALADARVPGCGTARVLLIGALVGLLSSVIPYSCELVALRSLRPAVFGILMSLEPAAAALAAIVVLHEHLSAAPVAGHRLRRRRLHRRDPLGCGPRAGRAGTGLSRHTSSHRPLGTIGACDRASS